MDNRKVVSKEIFYYGQICLRMKCVGMIGDGIMSKSLKLIIFEIFLLLKMCDCDFKIQK